MIPWLRANTPFPPVEQALDEPSGLLAAGADLSPRRLLDAYRHGIFPWYSEGQPILWWSTNPRMVLFTDELHVGESLRKVLRKKPFEVRINTAFRTVMEQCAAPRAASRAGTWIMPEMIDAYERLHDLGHAHSIESWQDGELVGGLYGVQIGRMFFGESMFTHVSNASKVALVHLVQRLRPAGFPMIDCQQETAHLASLGARPVSRADFATRIAALVQMPAAPFAA